MSEKLSSNSSSQGECWEGFYFPSLDDDKIPDLRETEPLSKPEPVAESHEAEEPKPFRFFSPEIEASDHDQEGFLDEVDRLGYDLGDKSRDDIDLAIRLYSQTNASIKTLAGLDAKSLHSIIDDIGFIDNSLSALDSPIAAPANSSESHRAICYYIERYDPELYGSSMKEEFLTALEKTSESIKSGIDTNYEVIRDGLTAARNSRDPRMLSCYVEAICNLKSSPDDDYISGRYNTKSSLLGSYNENHALSEKKISSFLDRVCPMIDAKDPRVEPLLIGNNSFATAPGDFGIGDFTIHALICENSPRNVRDLMQIYREIPTSDYSRFEQNRNDALALEYKLWDGHDFIHDERPGLHELFEAMINYYDTRNDAEEHAAAQEKLSVIVADRKLPERQYTGFDGELCFDLANYDKHIKRQTNDEKNLQVHSYDCPAIDILRNLEKNTRQVSLEKPHSGMPEIDSMIDKLAVHEMSDGRVEVELKDVSAIISKLNEFLVGSQGETNLDTDIVHTLSYMERMATYALRGISEKERTELPFDPGFKEICRFNELTSSGNPYDNDGFEHFWNGFVSDCSRDWPDGVDDNYCNLSIRVMININTLAKQYVAENAPRYMIDSLWSGNLAHEIMNLIMPR